MSLKVNHRSSSTHRPSQVDRKQNKQIKSLKRDVNKLKAEASKAASAAANSAATQSASKSSIGADGRPDYIKPETWDKLTDSAKADLTSQAEQQEHMNAANMGMFFLQQQVQQDAQFAEMRSQISRTAADAVMNTVRNIRA